MTHVTAVLDHGDDPRVTAAARGVAALLGGRVEVLRVDDHRADRTEAVVAALGSEDVLAAAIGVGSPDHVCWDVITRVACPVVVVPRASRRPMGAISRVLIPLDGAPETAVAVAGVAQSAVDAGASVRAVHVFDADTVPRFWDQSAHTQRHWSHEFLQKNLREPVELELRSGRPAQEVHAEADDSGADLVVIAWSQDLTSGRARTVREALSHGATPVLLVRTGTGPVPAADEDLPPCSPASERTGLEP